MNLHSLKNTPGARKRRMRVGRGESSGKGKTSGKGHKGQMSRTGHKHRPVFEGGQMPLIRRIPKRGFTSPNRVEYAGVNIGEAINVVSGGEISPETLSAVGRVSAKAKIKILGVGEVTSAVTVKAHAFSASAKAKIEAAGGRCEVIQ